MNAIDLLWAIGLTLGSWILLGCLGAGVGLLALRLVGPRTENADSLLPAFWVGLCLFIGFLQVYHFAQPIDQVPLVVLGLFGVAGLWLRGRGVVVCLVREARAHPLVLLSLAVGVLFLANRALASPGNCYDTGLYHASVVRWSCTYPVVPGLANLHFRLGFNNSIHLFGAAITAGPWGSLAPHIVNGLIFAALIGQGIVGICRLFTSPDRSDAALSTLSAVVLPPFALMACQYEITGYSSDGVAAALLAIAASHIMGMTLSEDSERDNRRAFFLASLLLSTAVTVKLSTAPFAGVAWVLAAALFFQTEHLPTLLHKARALLPPVIVAAALIAPWMIRGIILSGYPLFPSKVLAVPVSWRVPAETADALTAAILSWARSLGEHTDSWFGPWAKRALLGQVLWISVPLVISIVGVVILAVARRRLPVRLWLILPCAIGIVAWFITAPDPRFSFAMFWILAATLLGATTLSTRFRQRVLRHAAASVTLALLVAAITQRPPFIGPGSDRGFHPMPPPEVRPALTDAGLSVYLPVFEDKCWDAPLPCAPFLTPGLRERVPGNLGAGFYVEPTSRP